MNQAPQPGEFFKGLFVPCPWTWQWLWLVLWGSPPGGPADPHICCLPQDGSIGELEAPMRKEDAQQVAGAEGVCEPPGALPSSHCHPKCKRKGKRPREKGTAWERCPAALPSWSWGRPQGRAGGWREGGRICGESCGLSWGLFMGHRAWSPATPSLSRRTG